MSTDKSGPTNPGASSPFADVRAAFEKLGTTDKTAFIVEATVGTIANAIEETSQRVSDWFEAMEHDRASTDSKDAE
ncbi:MAG: hypothetical protein AAGG50_18715 [Bacteroidota bacterium]